MHTSVTAIGDRAADQRAEQRADELPRREPPERKAEFFFGHLRADERHRRGREAAEEAGQRLRGEQQPDVMAKSRGAEEDARGDARAHDHHLASDAIREAAPERRHDRGREEVARRDDAGPHFHVRRAAFAQLDQVERQKRDRDGKRHRHRDANRDHEP
jgi:hypothetical protein